MIVFTSENIYQAGILKLDMGDKVLIKELEVKLEVFRFAAATNIQREILRKNVDIFQLQMSD